MSRRRFFAPPEAFNKQTVTLTGDEARHLRDVLRLKPGDEVFVFDGAGKEFRCTIESARRDQAFLSQCNEVAPTHAESPLQLTLAVALLKGEKFDLVVQKTTELGVAKIVPVMTRHADIHLRDVPTVHVPLSSDCAATIEGEEKRVNSGQTLSQVRPSGKVERRF